MKNCERPISCKMLETADTTRYFSDITNILRNLKHISFDITKDNY